MSTSCLLHGFGTKATLQGLILPTLAGTFCVYISMNAVNEVDKDMPIIRLLKYLFS